MTLEIKSERNFTFGTGEPAVPHGEAVETVKEILRAEQIAEMAKDVTGSIDWCRLEDDFITVDCFRTAENLYEMGYRKQVEGEWISVDDRLPDKNTMVLGFIHNVYADGSCWDNILVMELNIAGYFVSFNCSAFKDKSVTHWMPLPGAPKMKGGESDGTTQT